MMLEVSNIHAGYGDLMILDDVSFSLQEGETVSIIGPNGAGKTTLMRTIIGELTPTAGEINFDGTEITEFSSDERVTRGLSLVPEERHLFRNMTVRENLVLGSYSARKGDRDERLERVYDLFPRLEERLGQSAGTLSGGEAQMLTLGRALMADPEVLLLDEPSIGLAPKLIPELFGKIEEINDEGVSIVIVEQRVKQALDVADRGYLLEDGRTTVSGPAGELLDNEDVVEKYLGGV
jgi:branched-chain amino acid transport system ATP-binding protein